MEVQINFRVIDLEYSQAYADEYQGGEESESNWKYKWAVQFRAENVSSTSAIKNEDFLLKGQFEGGEHFEHMIPNVFIYRCQFEDGSQKDFAVSKSILDKTYQAIKEGYDVTRFYFYIKDDSEYVHLGSLVVDEKDLPKEFLEKGP